MATKKIPDLTTREDMDDTVQFPAQDAIQSWKVTGAQIKAWIKEFLSDDYVAPTVQKFTSGSGTYTTPAGVKYIRVRMVGGGGGGGGGGSAGGSAGGAGGNTTFGTSLLTANGGSGGDSWSGNTGGAGGTATISSPAVGTAMQGGAGSATPFFMGSGAPTSSGGSGAASPFGGQGSSIVGTSATNNKHARDNTGSGGAGGGSTAGTNIGGGGGGGAGGYIDAIITSPSATYSYSVGAGGTAGNNGTNGGGGGVGGSGVIIVEEYYE